MPLESMVRDHLQPLRGYVASLGAQIDLVDDLAQDVFLEAIKHQDRYDRTKPFRSWLFGIARNLIRQEMRKKKLDARVRSSRITEYLTQKKQDSYHSSALDSPEIYQILQQCMDKLKSPLFELIRLRFEKSRSINDISDIVDMKGSAVRMALMRARSAFYKCIKMNLGGAV